ncbi:MAG: nucleoside triphosphate pyrophosphohydrolase [Angelakisella sp.]
MEYNKLVRDNIPDIIRKEGYVPKTEILTDERFLSELDKKLSEEVGEYQESKKLEELADILEVVYAICNVRGYSLDELMRVKEEKQFNRGGFSKKLFLISKSKAE